MRYPCAPWTSTPSAPAPWARRAASTNRATMSATSGVVISRTGWRTVTSSIGEGAGTGSLPLKKEMPWRPGW